MSNGHDLEIRIGRDELQIRQRYETLSILNDIVTGLLFLVGSVLFFGDSTAYTGTWLFVLGSVLMLIRPCIRLTRRLHLQRIHPGDEGAAHESSMDF
ncbi:YrhK family protein [Flexivirga sp. B27]